MTKKPPIDEKTAKEIIKVKDGRDGRNLPNNPNALNLKAGDNAMYLKNALTFFNLPPIDTKDPKQVEERVNFYFTKCIQDDIKPTVNGMALSLGVDRTTLHNWNNNRVGQRDEQCKIIQNAYRVLEMLWEDYMQNGKINPVSGIFLGKNHFGYKDQQEIVVEPKNPLGNLDNPEDVQRKYLEESEALSLLDGEN